MIGSFCIPQAGGGGREGTNGMDVEEGVGDAIVLHEDKK